MSSTHVDGEESRTHPLESIVWHLIEARELLDVTTVAVALCGVTSLRPAKGMRAYRIVAADVLGYMASAGRLLRHGTGTPHRPEDGSYWYTPAPDHEPPVEE